MDYTNGMQTTWGLQENCVQKNGDRVQKNNLCAALNAIDAAGSYASMGVLDSLRPDLVVQDVGEIQLPLSEVQAQHIIEKARRAPFGKGSETIVDT